MGNGYVRFRRLEPAQPRSFMDKIRITREALRCHTLGWLAAVPVIGFFVAPVVLVRSRRLKGEIGREWNAATPLLRRGARLALFSLGYHALLAAWIVVVGPDFSIGAAAPSGGG
jgi:hypothetical protein